MRLKYTSRPGKKTRQIILRVLATFLIACSFFVTEPSDAQTAAASGLRLIGTIQGRLGGAVFQDAAGKQSFIRINDKLPDGSRIVKLFNNRISLKGTDGSVRDMYISHNTKKGRKSAAVNRPVRRPSGQSLRRLPVRRRRSSR